MIKREYAQDENPTVGDVVEIFEGAYGAAIVTSKDSSGSLVLERTHCSVGFAQVEIGVERLTVSMERVRQMPVYVTGRSGNIDNRAR
jgi:hypothetical protein